MIWKRLYRAILVTSLILLAANNVSASDPVLLVHGLWGGPESWAAFTDHLRSNGWYQGCLIEFPSGSVNERMVPPDRYSMGLTGSAAWASESSCENHISNSKVVFRVVFRDNDSQSFATQGKQVAAAVAKARNLTGRNKVTIVAHSMGGLAARAYLQSPEYRGDVGTLVTVATPHLGSLLPYLDREDTATCRFLARYFGGKNFSASAVGLLRPTSREMLSLNQGQDGFSTLPHDVRFANIIGNYEAAETRLCFRYKAWLTGWQDDLGEYFNATEANSLVSGGVYSNWSDGIVPVASQYLKVAKVGYGLDVEAEVVEGFHSDLPNSSEVWSLIGRYLGTPAQAAPLGCDMIDLALLIDSSGSMKENDPRGLRKEAASLLVDRVPSGTVFSVVDFDSSASVTLNRSSDAGAAKSAVQRVDANGGTNIEGALKTGYQTLASGSGARAAILFTDGRSTSRGGTEGFVQAGIPVHVVGLGSGVDTNYLQRLAASTNGLYMHAAGAADLAEVFDRVVSELACEGSVLSKAAMIKPDEQLEYDFLVDATLNRVIARVTWPGSRIDLQLVDPSGRTVGVEIASGPTYRIVAVDTPEPGNWKARVIGTQVNPSGEPISLRIGGPSNLRLTAMQPDRQDPSLIQVSVIDNGVGANVRRSWSRIRNPKGKVTAGPPLTPSGSGAFTLAVPVGDGGIYTVTAGLEGDSPTARQWAREVTRTVVIGSGMVPWRGRITRVEGSYLTIDRGSRHGVREGMRVTLKPGRLPTGTGLVVSTFTSTSTVEVQELTGSALPTQGMTIELDRKQWMADTR